MNYAVITGDVINYSRLDEKTREKLMTETNKLIRSWVEKPSYAAVFRADSFQMLFSDIGQALKRSIQIRCWLKKTDTQSDFRLDAKLAVGIGNIATIGHSVLDSDGQAFHLSGRNFDAMKESDERFRIISADERMNGQLHAIMSLADIFITEWTTAQAEVIFLTLEGKKQQDIARELGIAQSAVSNRLKLSRWDKIDETMSYIASLLDQ
ncbi:MAG TPA: SatD family protein [Mucilaginibacter sp.]|nr:SatD family protein [Mucilaginibacter sp.]